MTFFFVFFHLLAITMLLMKVSQSAALGKFEAKQVFC